MIKKKVRKERLHDIVGVRFQAHPGMIWHYKALPGKVHLGQALVVENHKGTSVCFAVQINAKTTQELYNEGVTELKWVRQKVAPL